MGRLLGLATVVVLVAACGSAQVRPVLLATVPAADEVVSGQVSAIRLEYDSDVYILNPAQLAVSSNGVAVAMAVWVDPATPTVVHAVPLDGAPLGPGWIGVTVAQGLVANVDGHYSLEMVTYAFHSTTTGTTLRLPKPSAPVVAVVPPLTTPAPCHWVQLADGEGTGSALAAFAPEDRDFTSVPLTSTSDGDLVAEAPALAVSPDGREVFAAYRDVAAERVRLCRIDGLSRREAGTRLLSAPASAGTRPLALRLTEEGRRVRVRCQTNFGTVIVEVDAATLEEVVPSGW